MRNYFEFPPAIQKEMLFKDFAIFSSGGHLILGSSMFARH